MMEKPPLPDFRSLYEATGDIKDCNTLLVNRGWLREWGESCARMAREEERANIRALVLDDAWALTFQTFGQYRTALAAAIRKGSE